MATERVDTLADVLRTLRVRAGLSQESLAEKAGLSVRGVSDLERGIRRSPHMSTLSRLADALELEPRARQALIAAARPGELPEQPVTDSAATQDTDTGTEARAAVGGEHDWASPTARGLPHSVSSFIGRQTELGVVRGLLEDTRLLTLAGPGGIGKTRLALEVARLEADEDGVRAVFVELAPISDATLVAGAVAMALGVAERPGWDLVDLLTHTLSATELLLVLDNCEHIISAAASIAERLLTACPRVRVMATSRERLAIGGEVMWWVPSLELTQLAVDTSAPEPEAARLFIERARAVVPDFAADDSTLPAIIEICRRLDGIPLAIELAAARSRSMSLRQIAERLDDRFWLLVDGSRTALPRQRTLAATLEWSYQLLHETERSLLGRLAVFAGGFRLEAAESVCSGGLVAAGEVLDLLTGLVDKSLVLPVALDGGREGRFRMLETIRQFAADRLLESGETQQVRERHLRWAVDFAEKTSPRLVGAQQVSSLRELAFEHDNFRTALEWSRGERRWEEELRLAAALGRFWHLNGPSREGRTWLRHALEHAPATPSRARALALNWAGRLATVNGDADDRRFLEESVDVAHRVGDGSLESLALRHLSMAAYRHGDASGAQLANEHALEVARSCSDRREQAFGLVALGAAAEQAGDSKRAAELLALGLEAGREVGDAGPVGWALSILGAIAVRDGQFALAGGLLDEALALSRPMGYWAVTVASLAHASKLALAQGDIALARGHALACLGTANDSGDSGLMAAALSSFAEAEQHAGSVERFVRLVATEHRWRAERGAARFVSFWSWPAPDAEVARGLLGEAAFAEAWAGGTALSLDAAVAEALTTH